MLEKRRHREFFMSEHNLQTHKMIKSVLFSATEFTMFATTVREQIHIL